MSRKNLPKEKKDDTRTNGYPSLVGDKKSNALIFWLIWEIRKKIEAKYLIFISIWKFLIGLLFNYHISALLFA